jgi:S-adenosylmethionine decarboxylase
MAFNDTLFQLGMDLTRSSPAQKEDLPAPARAARKVRKDTVSESTGVRFAGRHLLVDLYGARKLDDIEHVERTLRRCVEASGATLLHMHLRHLKPTGGVTGVAVLEESHVSIHSWPEQGYAALDVFMSGNADPARAIPVLREAFEAGEVVVTTHHRGGAPAESSGRAVEARRPQSARLRAIRKAKAA